MAEVLTLAPAPQAAPAPAVEPLLQFQALQVRLGGRDILTPVDLSIARGEFVCIIGPSGCGKTTLLRAAAGFVKATDGAVLHRGQRVDGPSRDVAFVFQDYGRALLPWRTVAGNVALALEAARVPKAERPERVARVLQTVGLAAHADKFPAQLSGGMQQRLQIARCLAQQPSLLMMDEPFGALDAMTREKLQDELARLVREQGLTVMFVTHDLDEALYLGDRVVALRAQPGPSRPSLARVIDVELPRPRSQISTKEHPEFLRLRRELHSHLGAHHD